MDDNFADKEACESDRVARKFRAAEMADAQFCQSGIGSGARCTHKFARYRAGSPVTAKFYQGIREKLWVRGVWRLVVEETSEFRVVDNHGGIALNGVEVFLLESIARFRRDEHLAGKSDGGAGVFRSDGLLGSESFVDAHDEFGDVMKPGELRVVDDQAEKLAGVDVAVLTFVVAALHVEKSLVELEEREAERDQFLAGCGIIVQRR